MKILSCSHTTSNNLQKYTKRNSRISLLMLKHSLQWDKGSIKCKAWEKIQPTKTYPKGINPSETVNMHTTMQISIYQKQSIYLNLLCNATYLSCNQAQQLKCTPQDQIQTKQIPRFTPILGQDTTKRSKKKKLKVEMHDLDAPEVWASCNECFKKCNHCMNWTNLCMYISKFDCKTGNSVGAHNLKAKYGFVNFSISISIDLLAGSHETVLNISSYFFSTSKGLYFFI